MYSNSLISVSLPPDWPFIFQTMNYVRSNSLSLEYQRFQSSSCKDYGITNLSLWQIPIYFMLNLV